MILSVHVQIFIPIMYISFVYWPPFNDFLRPKHLLGCNSNSKNTIDDHENEYEITAVSML